MRSFIFDDTGTGKTKRAIDLISQHCNSILVVCPANVCATWVAQVEKWGEGSQAIILDGKDKSLNTANMWFRQSTRRPCYVIVSYDSMLRAWPVVCRMPKNIHWGVVFDESHYLKNQRSKRSQKSRKISERAEDVLMLTATPTPKNIEDIYGQCRTLYPKIRDRCDQFGMAFKTLGLFRQYYGVEHLKFINGRGTREYLYSAESIRNVRNIIQSSIMPIRVSDIQHHPPLQCPCSAPSIEEKQVYEKWMDEWTFDDNDACINAKTASDRAIKKSQLDDVFIYDDDDDPHWFGSSKIDSVWDKAVSLAEKIGFPTVVWIRFKAPFDLFAQRDNAVPAMTILQQNDDIQYVWKRKYQVIVASPRSSGTGIDGLQRLSCRQIWLDLPFTYAEFYQANSRLERRGQKREVYTYIADTPYNHDVYSVILGRKRLDEIMRRKQGK